MKREEAVSEEFNAQRIAKECDANSKGSLIVAANRFIERARLENASWFAAREHAAVLEWAKQFVMHSRTAQRTATVRAGLTPLDSQSMTHAASAFWTWPVNGIPLCDARRADLDAQADRYQRDSRTFAARGQWLRSIAERMTNPAKRVKEVLDESAIFRMAAEAGVVASSEKTV